MKRILFVAIFIVALPLATFCQQPYPNNAAKTARALMKQESRWVRAVLRHDVRTMDKLLAYDYVGVSSGGDVKNKAQTMADFRSAPVRFLEIKLDDFNLRVEGDSYVVSGRAKVKARVGDQVLFQQFRYAKIYVKRRGRWQVIEMHMTHVTEE